MGFQKPNLTERRPPMVKNITFNITEGVPFSRDIVVTFPSDRAWWVASEEFEVLFQLREKDDTSSTLILDLMQFVTWEFADDVVSIQIRMTGQDTRSKFRAGGFYDIFLSDVGATDARAIKLLKGRINKTPSVTADTKGKA